jgi:hypothetical protein
MVTGMQQDFSWKQSARQYIELYKRIQTGNATSPALPKQKAEKRQARAIS